MGLDKFVKQLSNMILRIIILKQNAFDFKFDFVILIYFAL